MLLLVQHAAAGAAGQPAHCHQLINMLLLMQSGAAAADYAATAYVMHCAMLLEAALQQHICQGKQQLPRTPTSAAMLHSRQRPNSRAALHVQYPG
jgi:hypothetical protein